MVAEDSGEAMAIFRGDLLELASLLTTLQTELVPEGLSKFVVSEEPEDDDANDAGPYVITSQDLQNVLDYRRLLHEEEDIHNKLTMARDIGRSEKHFRSTGLYFDEQLMAELEPNQVQIKKFTVRTRRIDVLWTRLEVWWTKVVAQKLLLSSSKEYSEDLSKVVDCCSSPLLNLPGSLHFRKVMPYRVGAQTQKETNRLSSAFHENQIACCSLGLPPNKHTWNEFARISRMVMLLDGTFSFDDPRCRKKNSREAALKSPCCLHYGTINRQKHYQQALAKDFEFSPPHLMALWVRAQRNTQAMRHLWMLFKVFPKTVESLREAQPAHSLEFSGNPSQTRSRVIDCSKRVDQFVEWAVTNQVLFTHKHIQKRLMTAPMLRSKRKQDNVVHEQKSLKRSRLDFSNHSDLLDLRASALIFVLRWFVRRNRFVASFLVARDVNKQHLDLAWTESDRRSVADIFGAVVQNYRNTLLGLADEKTKIVGEDWSLARVEARILRDQNDGGNQGHFHDSMGSTICRQILAMLDALQSSSEWNAAQDIQIRHAKEDLRILYTRFFSFSSSIYELVDSTPQSSAQEVTELFLNSPRPFPDSCCACDETRDEESLYACANCERVFHVNPCSHHHVTVSLSSLAELHEGFGKLCLLNQPQVERIPDYTIGEPLEWESLTFYIERGIRKDGSVTPLGLGLRGVKECGDTFRRLSSKGATILDLAKIHSKEIRTGKTVLPVAGVEDGSIVFDTKVGDFCGKAAGLMPGDVVIGVEHLEIPDQAYASKKKFHDFSKIPKASQRNELLMVPSTKLRLCIRRPSQNIIEDSLGWYKSLRNINPGFPCFAETQTEYRFCDDCQLKASSPCAENDSRGTRAAALVEAQRCRAVIRRVGQESFASQFTDEDPFRSGHTGQVNHGLFFSLRRLDAMMVSIIARCSFNETDDDPTSLSSAFMLPPWVETQTPASRVEWAPERLEDEPVNLLCQALLAWQRVDEWDNTRRVAKRKLIRLFAMLIPPWCILPSNTMTALRTTGPPKLYLKVREPWLSSTCVFCCARPCEGPIACGHISCREMLQRDTENIGELKKSDAPSVLAKILNYNECSSLVGTTVLFHATDPLVTALRSEVIAFDHDNRSVEYIVASYIPADLVGASLKVKPKNPFFDKFPDGTGFFHLFPVVSSDQMKFVLDRCTLGMKRNDSTHAMAHWVSPDALNLDGVARYSLQELKKKISESDGVRRSMDAFVASQIGVEPEKISDLCDFRARSAEAQDVCRVRSDQCFIDEALHLQLIPPSVLRALAIDRRDVEDEEPEILGERQHFKSKFADIDILGGCDVMKNSKIVALNVLRPGDSSCALIYSDIHYVSPTEVPSLTQSLIPQTLRSPGPSPGSYVQITVLLQRSSGASSPGCYKGIGFGFEVVRWGDRRVLHVGRVHKKSPAFGILEAGDIILSAGGKSLDDIHSVPELVATFLGAPVHIRPNSSVGDSSGGDELCMTLSVLKESNIALDSVVLTIHRNMVPASPDDNQSFGVDELIASSHSPHQVFHEHAYPVARSRLDNPLNQVHPNLDNSHVIPSYAREQFNFSSDLGRLRGLVLRTAERRLHVESSHLYRGAGFGIILTVLECAVFLEALLNEQPKLGVRMLCPRYSIMVIDQEIGKMASWRELHILSIPRLSRYCYETILHMDFKRSTSLTRPETGEYFFNEDIYRYRKPIDILPIDRTAEDVLQVEEKSQGTSSPTFAAESPQEYAFHFDDAWAPERIRGGGPLLLPAVETQSRAVHSSSPGMCDASHQDIDTPEDIETNICITSLSVKKWQKQPVYSMVDDDDGREILVVGFLCGATSPLDDEDVPETVDVEVHYVQKVGYIAPPRVYHLYPEDTFFIKASAPEEAVTVMEKLHRSLKTSSVLQHTENNAEENSLGLNEQFTLEISAGLTVLGNAPDGREIIWMAGDPTALFIADAKGDTNLATYARDYSYSITGQSDAAHGVLKVQTNDLNQCCPWGCSVIADSFETRYALSFASLADLRHHCLRFHTYGMTASATRIGRDKQFFRIAEGEEVLSLCTDLSAAVMAHFPYLCAENLLDSEPGFLLPIHQLPSGLEFAKSPTGTKLLLAWSDARLREKLISEASLSNNRLMSKVVNVWAAIGNRFESEFTGGFRLSQKQLDAILQDQRLKPSSQHFTTKVECCQFLGKEAFPIPRRFQGCSLCSLPWETCVSIGSIDVTEKTQTGLGCMLPSEVSFDSITDTDVSRLAGKIGEAKEILLRVATLIQDGLRANQKVGEVDPVNGNRLWDDDNYEAWESFVGNCTTPLMLSQALVVLMGSIDRTKMPKWWMQDGSGWSTFQLVMARPNMDAFFLHLYVFDAALSETIGRSLLGEKSADFPKQTSKRKESIQQRMAKWLKFAGDLPSFAPFHGPHGYECLYCDDGGELLCCELCSNVAHPECCEPAIEESEITSDLKWICESCINDICQQKGIIRQNVDS